MRKEVKEGLIIGLVSSGTIAIFASFLNWILKLDISIKSIILISTIAAVFIIIPFFLNKILKFNKIKETRKYIYYAIYFWGSLVFFTWFIDFLSKKWNFILDIENPNNIFLPWFHLFIISIILSYFFYYISLGIYFKKRYKLKYTQLLNFRGYRHLGNYLKSASEIDIRSRVLLQKQGSPELSTLNLRMNHILYKIIKHNSFSLFSLHSYNIEKNPKNLLDSYKRSLEIADTIKDNKSIAWYSNMKLPSTFLSSNSVKDHLSKLFVSISKSKDVDARRIHLLFEDKFHDSDYKENYNFDQECAYLIVTLISEYLHGINSRVLYIKNYEEMKKHILSRNQVGNVFLLDYALYNIIHPTKTSYSGGEIHLLVADFTEEEPIKKLEERTLEYEAEKIYDIKGPLIFSVFKNNFRSMWNRDKYINYLEEIVSDSNDSNHNGNPFKNDLNELIKVYKEHYEVFDLSQFLKHLYKQPSDILADYKTDLKSSFARICKTINNNNPNEVFDKLILFFEGRPAVPSDDPTFVNDFFIFLNQYQSQNFVIHE